MYLATGVEPTNETAAIPRCSRIASTASLSPGATLNTPSARPAPLFVAGTPRDPAGGRAGRGERLREPHARRRVLLGRLEDERVAACERDRRHPHGNHHREVERGD